MLELDGVVVRYGATTAVDGVSLRVGGDAGTVALLGPSGCGKSTLLRAVAGLEPLTAGRISFAGQDLAGVPAHRRGFGLVFQDGQLFPHRDVAANVAFGLRMARWDRRERDARVAELLELVGLAGLGGRRPGELSGGQAQRVALARALAPRPRLLLLDEPLSALDRELRDRLAVDLATLLATTGTPALLVTHDHGEAAALGGQVAVMDAGVLRQVDAPRALWRNPADARVAAFLGYPDTVAGQVRAGELRTPVGRGPLAGPDRDVTVALGPESLRVVAGAADAAGAVVGEVLSAVPTPHGARLRVRVAGRELAAVGERDEAPGTQVALALDLDRTAVLVG